MNKILLISFTLVGLMLSSCEKEVDIKYHDIPPIPVIEAVLSPDGGKVGITLTTPMNEPITNDHLTDATVTLTDLTADRSYSLIPDDEGFYVDVTPGIYDHEYLLEVERKGYKYTAAATMYAPVEIYSAEFAWIKMPYDDVAVLQVRYSDNPTVSDQCYWVRVYRNGEIYQWNEQTDRTAENGVMNFFAMTSRRDIEAEDEGDVLKDGDIVRIDISPISRDMHDYLEALANDSSGPLMIDTERLHQQADSGIADFCLGYFMATSTVSTTLVYHPDDIPYAD